MLDRTALRNSADPDGLSDDWARAHADFHQELLEGCGSRRLLDIALTLREEAEFYRRWSVSLGNGTDRDVTAEHRELRDAAVARDPDRAERLIAEHLERTAELLVTCATDDHVTLRRSTELA